VEHAARNRFRPAVELLEDRNAPDNLAPLAVNDLFSFDEDELFDLFAPGVLGNDSDPDNDPLTAELVTGPSVGQLTFNSDGSFTYVPEENYHGTVTFTYRAFDGVNWSDIATVSLVINPVNDTPVALEDAVTTDEDTPITFGVLANDSDVDGDSFSIVSHGTASHGVVTLNGDSTFTYTPEANWNGTDSFNYTISDGQGGVDTAQASVTVTPTYDLLAAVHDDFLTEEDTPVTVDVLENDDTDALLGVTATQGQHGSVVVNPDFTLTYNPEPEWYGEDYFSYTLLGGSLGNETATVSMTVVWINDAPVGVPDEVTTPEDTAITFNILANDTDLDDDELVVIGMDEAQHGRIVYNGDGTATYTPNGDFNSRDYEGNLTVTDNLTYCIWDGIDGESCSTIEITVTPVNDEPIAYHDAYHAPAYEEPPPGQNPISLVVPYPGVMSNDIDYDYADQGYLFTTLQVASWDDSQLHGSVSVNLDGGFEFWPEPGFVGWTYFSYSLTDGVSPSEPAAVWLLVQENGGIIDPPPTDPVLALDDEFFVGDANITGDVSLNDTANLDLFILSGPPKHGRLIPLDSEGFTLDGTFVYQPDKNFGGQVPSLRRTNLGYNVEDDWNYVAWADDGRTSPANVEVKAPKPYFGAIDLRPGDVAGHERPMRKLERPMHEGETTPGAFLHFNIDNDNGNTTAGFDLLQRPLPNASIADYTEVGPVSGENDLGGFGVGLAVVANKGVVRLTRDAEWIRIWRSKLKGAGNELLVNNNDKTWDLSIQAQHDDFYSLYPANLLPKLFVEGYDSGFAGDRVAMLTLTYQPPVGPTSTTKIKYTFFGAGKGRQPTPAERDGSVQDPNDGIYDDFPNLVTCEWSIVDERTRLSEIPILGNGGPNPARRPDSRFYNCYAWTINVMNKWWHELPPVFQDARARYFGVIGDGNAPLTEGEMDGFYSKPQPPLTGQAARPANPAKVVAWYTEDSKQQPEYTHGARNNNRAIGMGRAITESCG
jgi:VCBS repeat-containing protein